MPSLEAIHACPPRALGALVVLQMLRMLKPGEPAVHAQEFSASRRETHGRHPVGIEFGGWCHTLQLLTCEAATPW